MLKKATLTIGIPAFNEEKNIGYLLESILKQKQSLFHLDKIIIVADGCKDNTVEIAEKYAKKNIQITLINFKKRRGKAGALNKIYSLTNSSLLLTLDADVVLDRDIEIQFMVKEMLKNPEVNLVGGRFIAVEQKTLMGQFSNISYLIIEDAFLRLNNGINFYSLVGSASLIRKKLYKSFSYPAGVISEQNYLFAKATQNGLLAYRLARNTRILIRTVSTFRDWRLLGARSVVEDKLNVVRFFGIEILKYYSMPKKIYLTSILKHFLKSPFYTLGSVLMNIFIRLLPYKKAIVKEGVWEIATSSKEGIIVKE